MDENKQQSAFDAPSENTPNDKQGSQQPSSGFDLNRPTIISLLYLGSYLTGFSGLVGLVLAYVWKAEPQEEWLSSHYTYLIRTFWLGLVGSLISFVLMIVAIGFVTIFAVAVWVLVRCVMSLINAQKQQPMPDPGTWLI